MSVARSRVVKLGFQRNGRGGGERSIMGCLSRACY